MVKVGVTGNIGSGKSVVCKVFEHLGIPVFYADEQGKRLMTENEEVVSQVTELFGPEAYTNGSLNREFIASQVFDNPAKLAELNAIVHPAVGNAFDQWSEQQNAPYCIEEAAILFESGGADRMHANIIVTAPEELRISRVIERDGVDRMAVESRMKNQWPESQKVDLADYAISNGDSDMVIPQVLEVHNAILARCGKTS